MFENIIKEIKNIFSDRCEFCESCDLYQNNEGCNRQRSGTMIPCGKRRELLYE